MTIEYIDGLKVKNRMSFMMFTSLYGFVYELE